MPIFLMALLRSSDLSSCMKIKYTAAEYEVNIITVIDYMQIGCGAVQDG